MIDYLADLKSDEEHRIIYALLDLLDYGTFDERELWDMTADELKQLPCYDLLVEDLEWRP